MHKEVIKYLKILIDSKEEISHLVAQDIIQNLLSFNPKDHKAVIDYILNITENKISDSLNNGNLLELSRALGLRVKLMEILCAWQVKLLRTKTNVNYAVKQMAECPLFQDEIRFTGNRTKRKFLNQFITFATDNHQSAIELLEKRFKNWGNASRSYEILWKIKMSFCLGNYKQGNVFETEAMKMLESNKSFEEYMDVVEYLTMQSVFANIKELKRCFKIMDFCIWEACNHLEADKIKAARLDKANINLINIKNQCLKLYKKEGLSLKV